MQSPSSEANWFAASQEIPRISRNPKVHYRIHKRPPDLSLQFPHQDLYAPLSSSIRAICPNYKIKQKIHNTHTHNDKKKNQKNTRIMIKEKDI